MKARKSVAALRDGDLADRRVPPEMNDERSPHSNDGECRGDADEPETLAAGAASFDPEALEAGGPAVPTPPGCDPYDPASLGLSQDFAGDATVKQAWDII